MSYTPPIGNAVAFNFFGSYAPPTGTTVVFDFGVTPTPPPPGNSLLPTGKRLAMIPEEDWFFLGQKSPTPPIFSSEVFPVPPRSLRHAVSEEWFPPHRRSIHVVPPRRRMPVNYVVV